MRHGKAVIALVSDEDFAIAADQYDGERAGFGKEASALHIPMHSVDPAVILSEQALHRRLAAHRLTGCQPAGVCVFEEVGVFPSGAVRISLPDSPMFDRFNQRETPV